MRVEETFAASSLYFKCQQVFLLSFPFSLYLARDNFTISTYSLSWAQGTREEIERQLGLPHYNMLFSYLPEKPLIKRHSGIKDRTLHLKEIPNDQVQKGTQL